jgi:hypothetical protein
MKENDQNFKDPQLNALLREARVSPGLPPRFRENVWRRIEHTEAPAKTGSWIEALAGLILRPKFALTAASAILLAGLLVGTWDGRLAARHDAQMNYLASVVPHATR